MSVIRIPSTLLIQGGYLSHGRFVSYIQEENSGDLFLCILTENSQHVLLARLLLQEL